ncbi:hypothetical protein YC2023_074489 [Brassica napus]
MKGVEKRRCRQRRRKTRDAAMSRLFGRMVYSLISASNQPVSWTKNTWWPMHVVVPSSFASDQLNYQALLASTCHRLKLFLFLIFMDFKIFMNLRTRGVTKKK